MKITRVRLFIVAVWGLLVLCGSAWAVEVNDLVAHWKFDEGSGDIAYDSAGDNDGTLVNGPTWTNGQVGGALSFDGVDDYVDCGSSGSLDITDGITIGAWVKRPNFWSAGLIAGKTNGNFKSAGYGLLSYTDGLEFAFYSGGWRRTTPRVTIPANEWHYVVATFDGNNAYLYVDGEQSASLGYVGAITAATGYSFHISFWRPAIPHYLNGKIDDVRIYDRALSAEEVERLYWEGFSRSEFAITAIEDALDKKLEALERVDAALESESLAYQALEELLESGDYGDLNKGDIVKAKQKVHSAMQHQAQSADALEKGIGKLEDALSALGWEPNLVAHWKFDEGSGTIAYDSAGDNDGTIYGAQWTTGQIDGALSFDGVDDYVDCEADLVKSSQGTIGFWIKTSGAVSPKYEGIIGNRIGTGSDWEFQFAHNLDYGHVIDIQSPDNLAVRSVTVFNDNQWHHVAGTWGGSIIALYVDGILEASNTSAVMPSEVSKNLWIGTYYNYTDRYFNGIIDDVRIYDRALSAEEIEQLYQDGLTGTGKGKGK